MLDKITYVVSRFVVWTNHITTRRYRDS